MRDWNEEIEKAKVAVINCKRTDWQEEWRKQWYKEHKAPRGYAVPEPKPPKPPEPPKEALEVKAWFVTQWNTGFCVVDMQELMKKPKKQRDEIFALGNIR